MLALVLAASALAGEGEPQAPSFTSASSATFVEGTEGTFDVTATGNPAPSVLEIAPLPSGVTYDAETGVLAGTPTQSGEFELIFDAGNGVEPEAVQDFTLTVDAAPSITSASSTTFTDGTNGSFAVTASGFPAPTLTETGVLPSGVTFSDGQFTGDPTQSGVFPVTIEASNGVGAAPTQSFTLTADAAPSITSASSTAFVDGTSGSFQVTASGYPALTFSETGTLPSGVTLNPSSGLLSGNPTVTGTFNFTIYATNGVGLPAQQSFTLTAESKPAITSASKATFTQGTAGTFAVTATGYPAPTITETGALPAGVTLSGGVLSGTPTQNGVFAITLIATNGVGTPANQSFTLTVNGPPAFTSATSTSFTQGVAANFPVTSTGTPAPTLSEWGNLPLGITFSKGALSGIPEVQGTYEVTFIATNASGTSYQEFTLTVVGLRVTTSTLPGATIGSAYSQSLAAAGGTAPYTWKLTGGALPAGLKLGKTGTISGTPSKKAETSGIQVTVTDSSKTDKQTAVATFTITVSPPAASEHAARPSRHERGRHKSS